jgi:hypothetical protein
MICLTVAEIRALQARAKRVRMTTVLSTRCPPRRKRTPQEAARAALRRKACEAAKRQTGGFRYDDQLLTSKPRTRVAFF